MVWKPLLANAVALMVISYIPFLLIFLAVMFYYSWPLTLLVLAILTCIAAISFFTTPMLRQRLNQQAGGCQTEERRLEPRRARKLGDDFRADARGVL